MLTIFLPPFPFRGVEAPYLWVFYKFLHESEEALHFLMSPSYLQSTQYFVDAQRWEVEASSCDHLGYSSPSEGVLAKHHFSHFDDNVFTQLMESSGNNPILAFKRLLTERIPFLEKAIKAMLFSPGREKPDAIVSCLNCPSLEAVAEASGVPVIHIELGPLRAPNYRWTAYFDFSGVNGNTEAESRFQKVASTFGDQPTTVEKLREFFIACDYDFTPSTPDRSVGVPLQVEDDSNLIAYSNGYDNNSLIAYARHLEKEDLLIRAHPNSQFAPKTTDSEIDDSANSIEFIGKCREIITINSSVGLEALLFERKVTALGDNSFAFINQATSEQDKVNRLGFYLFSYLIPFDAAFSPSYIRFRLQNPSELEILKWHMKTYGYDSEECTSLAEIIHDRTTQHIMEKIAQLRAHMAEEIATLTAANQRILSEHQQALAEQQQTLAEQQHALAEQMSEEIATLTAANQRILSEHQQALAEQQQTLAEQQHTLAEQQQVLAEQHLSDEIATLTATNQRILSEHQEALAEQQVTLAEQQQALAEQQHALTEQRALVEENQQLLEQNQKLLEEQEDLARNNALIVEQYERNIRDEQARLATILSSSSWKVTKPLRYSRRVAATLLRSASTCARQAKRIFSTIKSDPKVLLRLIRHINEHGLKATLKRSTQTIEVNFVASTGGIKLSKQTTTYILTTKHCIFVAELIKRNLEKAGFPASLIFEAPATGFESSLHFVICPQIFTSLPGTYIAFQMEQSVSSRWFEESYLRTLENSYAIFDYSTLNVQFLQDKGLSLKQVYYTPISYIPDYATTAPVAKEYDILFYGDANNERRQKYLAALKSKYKTKVISNIFGKTLYNEIAKAKLIVNIHYYEGALLETTRIYECLSKDALIVSESSSDIEEHNNLQNIVDFTKIGDIDEMMAHVDYWLADDARREQKIALNREALRAAPDEFEYYFQRFLLATDHIDFDTFYDIAGHNIEFKTDYVCLGLPESTERRKDFEKDNKTGFQYFPGLRHSAGWIGCGLSYKFILRKAYEQKFKNITVCEDDVEFLDGWKARFDQIHEHLESQQKDWDIFSGLIANLHADTNIRAIEKFDEFELIHIDKMTSTVLNTYNASVFPKVIKWDENFRDPYKNTIDRFIENQSNIDVITTAPFLVGHKEELMSTLWGFQNSQYTDMIAASTLLLQEKVSAFKDPDAEPSGKAPVQP
ncbi:membrane-bound metallopeptidase [Pseudomonas sp. GM79]|uniref:GT99 family glycosyltransferase N-terminal domain-containing protein n=1 Tax=Pseudomonas sp. GM79 TaxID=1144338 RepID=UPI00026F84DB|nr:membrane-bound metallopeptidase [Pseudomonas sp. GM79]EJN23477.1 membrane-bound metallopeptidase [Pseudomonas sp. GM79]